MKAPWDYSKPVGDGDGYPNEPTEQGIALGKELARIADIAEAEQVKHFPNQLPRCDDCAFSAGTRPNGCSETLMDAIKCVVELNPFYCHKGCDADGNPRHICRGWFLLVSGSDKA